MSILSCDTLDQLARYEIRTTEGYRENGWENGRDDPMKVMETGFIAVCSDRPYLAERREACGSG